MSVVIRVRNDPKRLRQAVSSVRRAALDVEIVIVDNESLDETYEVAQLIGDVVVCESGAVGDLLRKGALHATRDVLFFLDADQQVGSNTLTSARAALRAGGAVIVAERPLVTASLWHRTLAVERAWAEASGVALPRVFWRELFLGYVQPEGSAFGEDRFIAEQVEQLSLSAAPLFHDEPRMVELFSKYYRYGLKSVVVQPTTGRLGATVGAMLRSVPRLAWPERRLIPLVLLLKVAKATIFFLGKRQVLVLFRQRYYRCRRPEDRV